MLFHKMQENHANDDEYKASKPLFTHYFLLVVLYNKEVLDI